MTTTINASTTAGLVQTADTSGVLALQTAGTTALSISASQVVTLTNALPVASGGSGVTTSTGTGANVLGTSPTLTSPTISGAVVSSMASSVITSGTAVASTSGTSIDFTSLPSWVKRITVMFSGVSTNGTSNLLVQIGSSSVSSSGYACRVVYFQSAVLGGGNETIGFPFATWAAANIQSGAMTLTLLGSNTWVATGYLADSGSNASSTGGVSPALGGALDRVRITTAGGTNTFDAGSVNILYE